jgi:5-histidylcysteine sulfoxide synthase/putative 4-mercaptohistidine N1-methyltranferase
MTDRTVALQGTDPEAKREEIRRYFHASYDLDERLFEVMARDEAFYRRADPLRHPLIFYLGHTAAFYVNKLIMGRALEARIEPRFESMFAIGVDEMSWDDLDERHYDWPRVAEVWDYRRRVRAMVDERIRSLPLTLPISWDDPFWVVLMGIEHSRIHLETSSVLIRQLPLELLQSSPHWPLCPERGEPPANDLVEVPAGVVELGRRGPDRHYGWDNEYGRHRAEVPAFAASRMLVSQRAFLGFVEDGGYRTERWWTDEGWRWRSYQQAEHPRFWRRDPAGWRLRCLAAEIEMPWNWPVEVNYLEAKAYCNWLAARTGDPIRLPSEDEWHRVRERARPDGAPGNLHLDRWASSCPVDRFRQGDFHDVLGNVWQWTETPIYPFEGFRVHPCYDDFSTPTFDDLHNLIKGGSWISTGNEALPESRYAFRRHFYQHAGFRYVRAAHPAPAYGDPYITERDVTRSIEAHWGEDRLGIANFHAALAGLVSRHDADERRETALHVNCGTGRLAFELARRYRRVLGLDFSARFIRVADALKTRGRIHYTRVAEGEIETYHEVRLADVGLAETAGRAGFFQDNAANLQAKWGAFDIVVVTDLLDRMAAPRAFLEAVGTFVRPGGLLLLSSAWQWREERTPRAAWLGGFKDATGDNQVDLAAVRGILAPAFVPVGEPVDLPRVRHESARRLTVLQEQVSVWRRR